MNIERKPWQCVLVLVCTAPVVLGQRIITTSAGTDWVFNADGKPAETAPIGQISQIATNAIGELFIADSDNHLILKIDLNRTMRVIAGHGIRGFSGEGGSATDASLDYPIGIAVDSQGNVYFSDSGNYRIRRSGHERKDTDDCR